MNRSSPPAFLFCAADERKPFTSTAVSAAFFSGNSSFRIHGTAGSSSLASDSVATSVFLPPSEAALDAVACASDILAFSAGAPSSAFAFRSSISISSSVWDGKNIEMIFCQIKCRSFLISGTSVSDTSLPDPACCRIFCTVRAGSARARSLTRISWLYMPAKPALAPCSEASVVMTSTGRSSRWFP